MKLKSIQKQAGFWLIVVLDVVLLALCVVQIVHPIFHLQNIGLFNSKGPVAQHQAQLILTAFGLMLLLALPVLATAFFIVFKYREGNKQAYDPDWTDRHSKRQILWWLPPALIIALMSIINFQSAHQLDPFTTVASTQPPMTIQVVALRWKWLFIYPDQKIATVNFLEVPQNVPLKFELTAEGPMSLFWIPQLGGQMAAMPAMISHLNLMAESVGDFAGQNSEINGDGYSRMNFKVHSVTNSDFNAWVASTKNSSSPLTQAVYDQLAEPNDSVPPAFYTVGDENLYNNIVKKYLSPNTASTSMDSSMQDMK
jgi:cytochrome o ubiquinol oxidase subunit 2